MPTVTPTHRARRRPRRRRSRARRADPRRDLPDRHERRSLGLRQRTTGARDHGRALPHRHHAGHQPRLSGVRRSGRVRRRRACGTTRAGRGVRKRPSSRRSSGVGTAAARGRGDATDAPRISRSTNPCSTCAGTRPTRTPAGVVRGCRRRRNGRSPPRARRREHANLWRAGPHRFAPSDSTRSHPDSVSKWGVHQMFGDVWEWTASDFRAYPNFESFPYREYSEVFFGPDYKVLRGGSWATHPTAMRPSFRNWDYPIRRQIFSGFRCARATLDVMCRHLAYLGPPVALHAPALRRTALALRAGADAPAPGVG